MEAEADADILAATGSIFFMSFLLFFEGKSQCYNDVEEQSICLAVVLLKHRNVIFDPRVRTEE